MRHKPRIAFAVLAVFAALLCFAACGKNDPPDSPDTNPVLLIPDGSRSDVLSAVTLPKPSDFDSSTPWVQVNGNIPFFTDEEKAGTEAFETYSELDSLGRCGVAYANVCQELMPENNREELKLGSVKPSGWHNTKYKDVINGDHLYYRCHLIGFFLTGETDNKKNLITGTQYLDKQGMMEKENEVAEYVLDTGNHVLYRVTPVYTGDNLLANGVLMEAYSVEDEGQGVQFCVFAFNAQPRIKINYANGDSSLAEGAEDGTDEMTFILNTYTGEFHRPDCPSAGSVDSPDRRKVTMSRENVLASGYKPCGVCDP